MTKFGAGRGSDTEGAGARKSRPTPTAASRWEKALRPLVGKKVESVRVDEQGVVYITAAGFGGRIIAKIGEPRG